MRDEGKRCGTLKAWKEGRESSTLWDEGVKIEGRRVRVRGEG